MNVLHARQSLDDVNIGPSTGLRRLDHDYASPGGRSDRSDGCGDNRLADTSPGAGDDEDTHVTATRARPTTSTARAISASVSVARAVSRRRLALSGTDGGRKQPIWTPSARHFCAVA